MKTNTGIRTLLAKVSSILVLWLFTILCMNHSPSPSLIPHIGGVAVLLTGMIAILLEIDEIPKPAKYTDTKVDRWLEHIEGY